MLHSSSVASAGRVYWTPDRATVSVAITAVSVAETTNQLMIHVGRTSAPHSYSLWIVGRSVGSPLRTQP